MVLIMISLAVAVTALAFRREPVSLDWFLVGFIDAAAVYGVLVFVRVCALTGHEEEMQRLADLFAMMVVESLRQKHGIAADVAINVKTHEIRIVSSGGDSIH
jgi:hypothetical protein